MKNAMTRRSFLKGMATVGALAAASTVLAGCGSSGGSAAAASSAAAGGSVDALEVKIWDNNQLDGLQKIADEWTAQSGVKVNINVVTWDNYWTLLEAGASGGEMPDVFWMHSNVAQKYMENDQLLNLNDYIAAAADIDLANYYEGITQLYSYNDVQYAIPKDHDTIALLYNKTLFDKCGVAYPDDTWTWEDYYKAGAAITAKGNGEFYGAAMNTSNNQDGYYNIIYSYGGCIINEDHTASGLDDPKTVEAMQFVCKLIDDVFPPQSLVAENGTDGLFTNGIAAMITQGSWMINAFYTADNAADYAWAQLPYCDRDGNGQCDAGERVSIYNGLGWAAAAGTKAPDAAWSLIEWFSTKENQVKQADLGVTMSGYVGASDDFADAFPGMDISAFLKIEEGGTLVFRPYSKSTTTWETPIQTELVEVWNDTSKLDAVLANLTSEMNALLAQEQ